VLISSRIFCGDFAKRMNLSDLEWPFRASRAISEVAEFLVSCF